MGDVVPMEVREIATGLQYQDFITVGMLLRKLRIDDGGSENRHAAGQWIYIQEQDVRVCVQIFNNWSPFMVKDPDTVWIGLEYFCNQGTISGYGR